MKEKGLSVRHYQPENKKAQPLEVTPKITTMLPKIKLVWAL
jgi:hypothetical protein